MVASPLEKPGEYAFVYQMGMFYGTPVVAEESDMTHRYASQIYSWLRIPSGVVLLGFLTIAAFFLITEHQAHVLGALPYVLLLLCPILHLLLHRSHLLAAAWRVLYEAQRQHTLAVTGPYARIRHPQYAGFILILLGFLRQWPTLLTLLMFPILLVMYIRLARREEREVLTEFGAGYARYVRVTPAFFPRLRRLAQRAA